MKLDINEKRKIIAKNLKTPTGRKFLAQQMTEPLKQYRDYEAVGRRALLIDQLANGDLPYYDKDIDTTAFTIAEDGASVNQIDTHADRVFTPLFEIPSLIQVPYTQLKQRRYDLETRVQQRTKIDIFRAEDRKIFSMFDAAITSTRAENPVVVVEREKVTFDVISDVMGLIERHGANRVTNIFINGRNATIFRKALKDVFEPITVGEIINNGVIGVCLGATIHTSLEVPEDKVYMTAEPEYTGRLVEATPLTVLNADNNESRMIGFSVFEQLGIYVQGTSVAGLQLV
jgi:hypothetical protein